MNMNIIGSHRSKAGESILDKVWWDSTEYCSWEFIYFWENYQTLWRIYYIILQRVIQGFKNTVLILSSQCIFCLLLFIVYIQDYFVSSSVYHNINTCQRYDLHLLQVSLAMYQKGVYCSGIKIFNSLPKAIKDISSEPKKFKTAPKHYLQTHSFYSLDAFFFSKQ
jgi:hypothetical protein